MTRRIGWIDDIVRDARYALRALRHKPTFAAMAVVSMSAAIPANRTASTQPADALRTD